MYIYIYRAPLTSIFAGQAHQNKAFSNQNKGHLGSRYLYTQYISTLCDILFEYMQHNNHTIFQYLNFFWWGWLQAFLTSATHLLCGTHVPQSEGIQQVDIEIWWLHVRLWWYLLWSHSPALLWKRCECNHHGNSICPILGGRKMRVKEYEINPCKCNHSWWILMQFLIRIWHVPTKHLHLI